ncbi:hypothetical protein QX776_09940 [Alteromonadaceae bacterium BrNp21-10]|nr:hypothetical protein [Alteromonadaceae bacterium BrNp21-10]
MAEQEVQPKRAFYREVESRWFDKTIFIFSRLSKLAERGFFRPFLILKKGARAHGTGREKL